jgi:hypothetical protein
VIGSIGVLDAISVFLFFLGGERTRGRGRRGPAPPSEGAARGCPCALIYTSLGIATVLWAGRPVLSHGTAAAPRDVYKCVGAASRRAYIASLGGAGSRRPRAAGGAPAAQKIIGKNANNVNITPAGGRSARRILLFMIRSQGPQALHGEPHFCRFW